MNKYLVREAISPDVPRLTELVNSAYRGETSKRGWTTEANLLGGQRIDADRLREVLKNPLIRILCAIDAKGEIISSVCLERSVEECASGRVSCYLGMLTVEPALQTGGTGKFMLAKAEQFARGWGATSMALSVIQLRPELMAWYERRGYKKTGELGAFPYGDTRFGEPKRDDLHFVMFEKPL